MPLPTQIIDAHHHLWNPETNSPNIGYVWLKNIGAMKPFGDPTPIQRDYLLEEFRSESPKIIGSVHLQCDGAIADPIAETAFIQTLCDAAQHPIKIVGFVDLAKDNAEATLQAHKVYRGFTGVRHILSRLDDKPALCFAGEHFLNNTQWRTNFALLAKHDLSFDAQLYPEQMYDAAAFFAQHPEIPIIIDHAGSPYDQTAHGLEIWKEGINALAALPQCAIKLCGFGMFDQNWHQESIRSMVEHIIKTFGIKRIMFGSNFPVDKLMRSYQDCVEDISAMITPLGDDTLKAVFSENAQRIYRF